MNIIEVMGGLGNQMFQAALYQAFENKGISAALDYSFYSSGRQERELALRFFPNADRLRIADEKTAAKLRGYGYHDSLAEKLRRKICGTHGKTYQEDVSKGYQPGVFEQRDCYVRGYWQCERYFAEYREDILDMFRFPAVRQGSACSRMEQTILEDDRSVSLHVRRGDYLEERYAQVYCDVCTETYYRNAIAFMRERVPGCHFYLFSDDPEWCREYFRDEDMLFVTCNTGEDSPYDMYLMSICRHNIIANSSFSWWGAWLNQNSGQLVAAPERWFHHMDVCDQLCDRWTKLSIQ